MNYDELKERLEYFKKEETIIVGDSLSSDIAGGKNAGILTIWFNPSKEKSSEKISADYEICNISDIFSVLNNIWPEAILIFM